MHAPSQNVPDCPVICTGIHNSVVALIVQGEFVNVCVTAPDVFDANCNVDPNTTASPIVTAEVVNESG